MEKNKDILKLALHKLPRYEPKAEVWESISVKLENNTSLIRKAQLSEVKPPDMIWANIDKELNRREKISSLTQVNPPEKIWETIELQLERNESRLSKRKTIQFASWTSAIAAILIIGFFISTLFKTTPKNLTYSEEWIEIPIELQWDGNEEEIEAALDLLCSERPIECQSPDFKKIQQELLFLTESKQVILDQLRKYESNTELEQLLVKIELERTSIIKELIEKII